MREENKWCPGCDRDLIEDQMRDIDSDGMFSVCKDCLAGMKPFERILLRFLTEPANEDWGGLNIGGSFLWLEKLAAKSFQAWHGHEPIGICRTCSPDEFERVMKRRRELEKKKIQDGI